MKLSLQEQANLGILGVKSGNPGKTYTVEQDKARSKSRYEEQSLVTAYCKWFQLQYKGIPYQINSKEAKRSYAAQNVLKKQEAYSKGVPDFQCDRANNKYHTLRLEFKKSYNELFTGNGLLRPGPEGHFYIQDDYHKLLQREGHLAVFVWDLELAMMITNCYMLNDSLSIVNYQRSQPDYDYQGILL